MIFSIENQKLKVSVETLGAQLKSIYDKEKGVEVLWQGNAKYWKGRAYNLFPIVGRLFDGKYSADGRIFEMDRHGFARGSEFILAEKTDDFMSFVISSDDKTIESYPFEFIFKVEFSLSGASLKINYVVQNVGKTVMYYGLGAHPGFNVPFDGGKFEDYYVEFESKCRPSRILFTPDCLISDAREDYPLQDDTRLNLDHSLFDDDAVVLENVPSKLFLKKRDGDAFISVAYPDMPFVGLWHAPKTDAPYLCVEPWQNLPSKDGGIEELSQKQNVGKLEIGEKRISPIIVTVNL